MTHLKLNLLGGLGITRAGVPIIGKPHVKARLLLAYLAVGARTQGRDALGQFFWPEAAQASARNNLRQTLFQIRQALGDTLVLAARDTVDLDHDRITLDVTAFLENTPSCPNSPLPAQCGEFLAHMERRVKLYRGPFLDGLTFENAPDVENWLCVKRETFHRQALGLLERLSGCHERSGNPVQALQFAQRYLELEPWNEAGHRRVMRLLGQGGHTAAALAQFEVCERMLHQELDALPDTQTLQLAAHIKAGVMRERLNGVTIERRQGNSGVTTPERRQITALYCGFAAPTEDDSDESATRLAKTRRSCCDLIRRMGGHVAQLHSGAILAYFGYPMADEHAAHKAVRTALALHMLDESARPIRVGLHTGMIVSDAELADTLGLTSNHAIGLRDVDVPVVMSESTFRLTEGYFHVESLGLQTLRDIGKPVRSYAVLGESGATHRLQASQQRGVELTPFVGRAAELKALRTLWKQVQQAPDTRRMVLVRGEAGIGKSRLVDTLVGRLKNDTVSVRELRCFPESSQSALHPLIVLLESICEFESTDTLEVKRDKFTGYFTTCYPHLDAQALALLAQLLSVPGGGPQACRPTSNATSSTSSCWKYSTCSQLANHCSCSLKMRTGWTPQAWSC